MNIHSLRRELIRFVAAMAIAYVSLVLLVYAFQGRMLFRPDAQPYDQQQVGTPEYQNVHVLTADKLILRGWYIEAAPGMPTLLVFHGNASTWQWRAPDFLPFAAKGYGVLLAGYRGYGGNPGKPSEAGFYQDADAYMKFLADNRVPVASTVLYGESLGTGVAIDVAARTPGIRALILEAPFTAMADLATWHYPYIPLAGRMLNNRFESLYKIGKVAAPKLFLTGGRDAVIPAHITAPLFEAAGQPKAAKAYATAGHNDIRASGGTRDTLDFLGKIN